MTGFGLLEVCAIFLLALVLFGPKELPKLARFIAKLIYELKNIFQRLEKEWHLAEHQNSSLEKDDEKQE